MNSGVKGINVLNVSQNVCIIFIMKSPSKRTIAMPGCRRIDP